MPISDRLTQKIFEVFGPEAGNDLFTWMRTIEGQYLESRALRELTSRFEARVSEAVSQLRGDLSRGVGTSDRRPN